MVRVAYVVAFILGGILMVAGVGLLLFVGPGQGFIGDLSILGSIPLILVGTAHLLIGSAYLSFVACRKLIRVCNQSLAVSGIALFALSFFAGIGTAVLDSAVGNLFAQTKIH